MKQNGQRMNDDRKMQRSLQLLSKKADQALKAAVKKAVQDHVRTKNPMAIWRNGKVVWVPASQLLRKRSGNHGKKSR